MKSITRERNISAPSERKARQMSNATDCCTEHVSGTFGDYVRVCECTPPEPGSPFVTEVTWNADALDDALGDGGTCNVCGEYAEEGWQCDHCRAVEENQSLCQYECKGKVHHATMESAAEHVASLGGEAYAYECDGCNEWTDAAGNSFDNTGPHWHVASSQIPRKWREWVAS